MKAVKYVVCCILCSGLLSAAWAQTRSKSVPNLNKPTTNKAGALKRSASAGDVSKGGPVNLRSGPGYKRGPAAPHVQSNSGVVKPTTTPVTVWSEVRNRKDSAHPSVAASARKIANGAHAKATEQKTLFLKRQPK